MGGVWGAAKRPPPTTTTRRKHPPCSHQGMATRLISYDSLAVPLSECWILTSCSSLIVVSYHSQSDVVCLVYPYLLICGSHVLVSVTGGSHPSIPEPFGPSTPHHDSALTQPCHSNPSLSEGGRGREPIPTPPALNLHPAPSPLYVAVPAAASLQHERVTKARSSTPPPPSLIQAALLRPPSPSSSRPGLLTWPPDPPPHTHTHTSPFLIDRHSTMASLPRRPVCGVHFRRRLNRAARTGGGRAIRVRHGVVGAGSIRFVGSRIGWPPVSSPAPSASDAAACPVPATTGRGGGRGSVA